MIKHTKSVMKRADEARDFPSNTCPASRHAQMIGENLARQKPYPMLTEEPEHCGGSILATVAALYEARSAIERLQALILDACKVFERYDLPEHAFHYRRAVMGLDEAKKVARAALEQSAHQKEE